MEIAGAGYLYTIALASLTYGGFAALFILFRQDLTGRMIHYDAFVIRGIVQKSFIVTACSLLPPLLALTDLKHVTIWRLSSLLAGALQLLFLLNWILRRQKTGHVPTSKWLVTNLFLQALVAIYLFVGSTDQFFEAGPGHFAIGVTLILFLSGIAYQEALIFLLQHEQRQK